MCACARACVCVCVCALTTVRKVIIISEFGTAECPGAYYLLSLRTSYLSFPFVVARNEPSEPIISIIDVFDVTAPCYITRCVS